MPAESLTCDICNKTFTQRRSRIRHTSYCRKKLRHPLQARKKSCVRCIAAKTFCDNARPACARCVKSAQTCEYEQLGSLQEASVPSSEEREASSSSTWLDWTARDPLQSHTPTEEALGNAMLGCSISPVLDKPEMMAPNNRDNDCAMSFHDLYSLAPCPALFDQCSMYPQLPESQMLETLQPPSLDYDLWTATLPSPQVTPASSLASQFILSTLKEYPRRLLKRRAPPPFIHSRVLRLSTTTQPSITNRESPPKLLTRSIELVQLWAQGRKEEEVWQQAQQELAQMWSEGSGYSDADTVAASQAGCIYMLLRTTGLPHPRPISQIDTVLRCALLSLIPRNRTLKDKFPDTAISPVRAAAVASSNIERWQNWILLESLHRSIHTVLIIDFVFEYMTTSEKERCGSTRDWFGVRLPASRNLWEASSVGEWMAAWEERIGEPALTFGDLVWSSEAEGKQKRAMERWMGEADELGHVLIAVAGALQSKWGG